MSNYFRIHNAIYKHVHGNLDYNTAGIGNAIDHENASAILDEIMRLEAENAQLRETREALLLDGADVPTSPDYDNVPEVDYSKTKCDICKTPDYAEWINGNRFLVLKRSI